METKINKKLPKGYRKKRRSDWQEKLPIKPIFLGAMLVILLSLLILFNGSQTSLLYSPEIDVLRARATLRIGVDDNIEGLYRNGVGFEADFAALLGQTIFNADDCVTIVPVNRHTALMSIEDGTTDLLIMTLTEVSDNTYLAGKQPFYAEPCVLVIREGFEFAEAEIAVLQNTPCDELLQAYEENTEPDIVIVKCAAYYDMLVKFRAGTVDALCLPLSVANTYSDPAWLFHSESVGTLSYYAVSTASNKVLLDLIDELIVSWANDGTLIELYRAHGLR
ncbi:MAG: transporter substrate-binding domain-containing protein [Clostridia bacterium]|nr:transporter substrate-binding domain-containing protein [Clostridia bacterium]